MAIGTADFDYHLPDELIAQRPVQPRDSSRLMVLDRAAGLRRHCVFHQLGDFLRPGDLLVVNDTRVIPARFHCRRRTGGRIEGLFLREHFLGSWEVMLKGADRCRPGEALMLGQTPAVSLVLRENRGQGIWQVQVEPPQEAVALLDRLGETPLPPYIRRGAGSAGGDATAYQTVYAQRPGAVAAPTAGLHFTPQLLAALARQGVQIARVTLHVGLGTFRPVEVERLEEHRMHAEWYELPPSAAQAIAEARARGGRVVAVGTTSVRVLESAAGGAARTVQPGSGWTDIFMYPPRQFHVVDALLTNFHLPRSTLLMLVAAFCAPGRTDGVRTILDAYAEAVREGYRFFSYGDAMLIGG